MSESPGSFPFCPGLCILQALLSGEAGKPEQFLKRSSGKIFSVVFVSAKDSVSKEQDAKGFGVLLRNSLRCIKNKGCTKYKIQYNHYYSEDLADGFSHRQFSIFATFFQVLIQFELDRQNKSNEYRFAILFTRSPGRHHRHHAHGLLITIGADTANGFYLADGSVLAYHKAHVYGTINAHTSCAGRVSHVLLDKVHHGFITTLKFRLLLYHCKDLVLIFNDNFFNRFFKH